MSTNFSDLLSQVVKSRDENLIEVYLPSIGKTAKFKQLSVNQQKDILLSGFKGAASSIEFINVINNIINENNVNNNDILVIDRPLVLLSFRYNSIGGIAFDENKKEIDFTESLNITLDSSPVLAESITWEGISIKLIVPSINRETAINTAAISQIKTDSAADLVGIAYTHEIIKYIDEVSFGDISIIAKDEKVEDLATLVNTFPAALNTQIFDFIKNNVRAIENKYLVIDGEQIVIDPGFFSKI